MIRIGKSKVHGKGVFATRDIKKGTVFKFDIIISSGYVIEEDDNLIQYTFSFNGKYVICLGFISLVNHSIDNNVEIFKIYEKSKTAKFIVTEDIKKGQELFLYYNENFQENID